MELLGESWRDKNMPVNVVCKHKCSKKPHWHIKHLAICLQSAATGCRITALDDNAKIMSVYLGSLFPPLQRISLTLPSGTLIWYCLTAPVGPTHWKRLFLVAYRANPFWKAPHIFSLLSHGNSNSYLARPYTGLGRWLMLNKRVKQSFNGNCQYSSGV